MAKIFIIEDDIDVCENVKDWLTCQRHTVEAVQDGREGLEHLRFYNYDLIILDWELPNMSGLQVCNEFRARGGNTPILFLTGKREIEHKEAGFEAGADDYLTKPFNIKELSARVKALLRRPAPIGTGKTLHARHVELDPQSGMVTANGAAVKVNPKEFALLEFLMRHPGQVFSAEALLDRVWASSSDATSEAITTCIKRLRQKLDVNGQSSLITTLHGMGYRLDP
jgi:DNA-binding response OmpR family regulator